MVASRVFSLAHRLKNRRLAKSESRRAEKVTLFLRGFSGPLILRHACRSFVYAAGISNVLQGHGRGDDVLVAAPEEACSFDLPIESASRFVVVVVVVVEFVFVFVVTLLDVAFDVAFSPRRLRNFRRLADVAAAAVRTLRPSAVR